MDVNKKRLRGFAAMDPQRQREISSLGGTVAHQTGRAHEFTSKTAREANRRMQVVKSAKRKGEQA